MKSALEEQDRLRTELVGNELHNLPQQLQRKIDTLRRQIEKDVQNKINVLKTLSVCNSDITKEHMSLKQRQSESEAARVQAEEERIRLERNQQRSVFSNISYFNGVCLFWDINLETEN